MALVLHGYIHSVYVRIARLTLAEKACSYELVEVDPFKPDLGPYLELHPFGRVPTLVDGGFVLYETGAITRYLDRRFPSPALQPTALEALARMDQIIGVVDSYAYWPLVRQVFAHRVMRPRLGRPADEAEIAQGLAAAPKVLAALERLAGPDTFLTGPALSLADLHLGAMIAYFVQAPEGAALLRRYPRLAAWWTLLSSRSAFAATDPSARL
ncbi:glutathione S-transferase [Enhydrobacter aerosaccus]|uniref:glutathione transferase n=1 Tax=Enhydrobacter aerosaccus TaxID=225324 RepID=A0A1T4QL57_9HYPH|nr:glutathione S-transferase family protein [Enhydrobacter aerosaccus]SKA04442.1 glutathione S-transferase [Enhydrobacter aerosaccus]